MSIDNRASARHTVIEVLTRDRPGLALRACQRACTRWALSIAVAKINTEGNAVADVFYVTEADGSKVAPSRTDVVRDGILGALNPGRRVTIPPPPSG